MSNKSFNESSDRYNVNSDGLRQKRLKNESRWRYNPKDNFDDNEEDDDFGYGGESYDWQSEEN